MSTSHDEHEWWHDRDGVVDLDVSWLVPADLCAVDALARLQVAAARCGSRLVLHGADSGLVELFEFVGLGDVVHLCPCCPGAAAELDHPVRELEEWDCGPT